MIEIKVVKNKKMLRDFINFPVKLYKDCEYFTPYLYSDEISNLTVKKNPASKYCIFRLFLAYKDKKIVPVSSDLFKTAAKRQKNSILSCDKLDKQVLLTRSYWKNDLANYIKCKKTAKYGSCWTKIYNLFIKIFKNQ